MSTAVQLSLDVCNTCALADVHDHSTSMAGQHQLWWKDVGRFIVVGLLRDLRQRDSATSDQDLRYTRD